MHSEVRGARHGRRPTRGHMSDQSTDTASTADFFSWFENMIDNCYDYAEAAKAEGRPIVGIMCEYAPRELIMAAGGIPVCLCGGSEKTIPPAEEYLPSNLCPLIKSTFGYHVTDRNPFLVWADLVVAETTCDGKKKMFELMAETKPVYVMELPQKQNDADAFEHWVAEMHKLKAELERRFRTKITPERIREAIILMNRERGLRRGLAQLMRADSPPITGRQLLDLKSIISGIPADLEQYEKALRILGAAEANEMGVSGTCSRNVAAASVSGTSSQNVGAALVSGTSSRNVGAALVSGTSSQNVGAALVSGTSSRNTGDTGVTGAGSAPVRVLLTGVPVVHGAERIVDIIEDSGGLIVCMENCTGIKPIAEDVDPDSPDLIRALAERYFRIPCAVMTPNTRRFEQLRALAVEYRAQCIVELVWQTCVTYDIESYQVRRLAEQELGIPYLRIETDYSTSDSARVATRLEALFEMIRESPQPGVTRAGAGG